MSPLPPPTRVVHVTTNRLRKDAKGRVHVTVFCPQCKAEEDARRAATERAIADAHSGVTEGKARAPVPGRPGRDEGRGSAEVVRPQPRDARPERTSRPAVQPRDNKRKRTIRRKK